MMYGVAFGDIAGSPYEFGKKAEKGFQLIDKEKKHMFTDDSVLTAAICNALLETNDLTNEAELRSNVRRYLQQFTIDFPFAGYGARFLAWVEGFEFLPYNSYGNGAAMRISPVAWVGKTVEEVFTLSDICTGVTHNHPEGIKGARAIALAVFLARNCKKGGDNTDKKNKELIKQSIQQRFYLLNYSLREIKDAYVWSSSCQGTVPQAIAAFLESNNYESAIRNAIEIGGDCDTIAAMTGAIAEAYYGVPDKCKTIAKSYLDQKLITVFDAFEEKYQYSFN